MPNNNIFSYVSVHPAMRNKSVGPKRPVGRKADAFVRLAR